MQQLAFDTLFNQTSDNGTAPDYLKTITSDFIYDKPPSTIWHLLVTPNQSGDVAIFAK